MYENQYENILEGHEVLSSALGKGVKHTTDIALPHTNLIKHWVGVEDIKYSRYTNILQGETK